MSDEYSETDTYKLKRKKLIKGSYHKLFLIFGNLLLSPEKQRGHYMKRKNLTWVSPKKKAFLW